MAFLRRHKGPTGTEYLYIVESYRRGGKVLSRVLEYLGREDRLEPGRLRKAIEYWGVSTKARRKARKGGRG